MSKAFSSVSAACFRKVAGDCPRRRNGSMPAGLAAQHRSGLARRLPRNRSITTGTIPMLRAKRGCTAKKRYPYGPYPVMAGVCIRCMAMCGSGARTGLQSTLQQLADTPAVDPIVSAGGSRRVLRGGGWFSLGGDARAAQRNAGDPGYRGHNLGFRLARTREWPERHP